MAALLPAVNLANLLSLPARHFAAVEVGNTRARILVASVARGRPRLREAITIDAHEEGFTTPEELHEEVRQRLRALGPEALVLVVPQHQMLRHVLDVPVTDSSQIRALVEREASHIGGLSESHWAFDATRLRPFARLAHPLATVFCRQDALQQLLTSFADDERTVFDVRPAGDALAAAFRANAPALRHAVLVDLGAFHTSVTLVTEGQAVFAYSFPSGSKAFTEALAADQAIAVEAAETLKRTEPLPLPSGASASPKLQAALVAWQSELERTILEWREDHPDLATAAASWPAYLAGGGALQPGLAESLTAIGGRKFDAWPPGGDPLASRPDLAVPWGALLLALGLAGPAPTFLPETQRSHWAQQRLWRAVLTANLALVMIAAVAIGAATWQQTRTLARKEAWRDDAIAALGRAQEMRVVAEGYNTRLDEFRPVLERQRHTVDLLQTLAVIQRQRTNANHWYVLLADSLSYANGSNHFAPQPPTRPADPRFSAAPGPTLATNPPPPARAVIAEVCLVPQGEQMRQALSDLVGELKRFPVFRNVDVLPSERRRELVATNLIFPERHFALELNLSESELLPPLPVQRLVVTNREPRNPFRTHLRPEPNASGTGAVSRTSRPR